MENSVYEGYVKEIRESRWSNPDMKIEGKRNVLQTDIIVTINELLSGEYENKEAVIRINAGYDKEKNVYNIIIKKYIEEENNYEKINCSFISEHNGLHFDSSCCCNGNQRLGKSDSRC